MELTQISHTANDCTALYSVELGKVKTLKDMLDTITTNPMEWGNIEVEKIKKTCEYKCGKVSHNFNEQELNSEILECVASGGWSMMNYYVTLK